MCAEDFLKVRAYADFSESILNNLILKLCSEVHETFTQVKYIVDDCGTTQTNFSNIQERIKQIRGILSEMRKDIEVDRWNTEKQDNFGYPRDSLPHTVTTTTEFIHHGLHSHNIMNGRGELYGKFHVDLFGSFNTFTN